MKRKQLQEIKNKTVEELELELKKLKAQDLEARVARLSGKEKNLKISWAARRDIAQILSIISSKMKEEKKD